tara:strand:+ start:1367 stop:1576 length:210 start_codon:yes stop_codon:yes gene_type:complete
MHNLILNDHERRINQLEHNIDKLLSIVEKLTHTETELDDDLDPVEADADALASAGFGTDEDYGGDVERL